MLVGRTDASTLDARCPSHPLVAPESESYPLGPAILESHVNRTILGKHKDCFLKQANIIQQEGPGQLSIPDIVDYGKACRGLCKSKTPQLLLAMQELLWDEWSKLFGPDSVGEDIFMVAEVYASEHVVNGHREQQP